MKLTDEQRLSIETTEGNVRVIASAGSGKTHSFTNRIANMINNQGIAPYKILAVTFTKRAAEEMQKRLTKLVGKEKANAVPMGTFHSIAFRLMKVLDSEFEKYKIAPDWWKMQLLNSLCKPREDKNPNGLNLGLKAGELSQFISCQKLNRVTPKDNLVFNEQVSFARGVSEILLREAYATYERLKEESRQIDYDDFLVMFYNKLESDHVFRSRIAGQYQYIMIDEFQDTSSIVLDIVKLINTRNVFVVGDWRQAIYGFIQADVNNILDFDDHFHDAKLIELNKNFRSTQNIVHLSNQIIANSPVEKYKVYKPSESVSEVGDKIVFSLFQDERKQAQSISDRILEAQQHGTPLSEIAVLVRTNAQTAVYEEVFSDRDIPYDVSKSTSFFDRNEILDLLSYARLLVDTDDDISFRRIINTPNRYLSKKFVEELERFAGSRDMSLMQAIRVTPQADNWKFKNGIDRFTKAIEDLHYQANSNLNAGKFLRNIIRVTRYMDHVNENTSSASSISEKTESIERLCEMASKMPNIKAFLGQIASIADKKQKSKGKDAVNIVTMHSSKGLEWDVVFVPSMNEEMMPHRMNPSDEEERRLFYVACSRPRKKLYVSWYFYSAELEMVNESEFIKELLTEYRVLEMKKELFRGLTETHFEYPDA